MEHMNLNNASFDTDCNFHLYIPERICPNSADSPTMYFNLVIAGAMQLQDIKSRILQEPLRTF